jgi:hypothetical protein
MQLKYCPGCDQDLDRTNFSKNAGAKDGLQHHCKTCRKEINKNYLARHPHKVAELKEYSKKWWSEQSPRYRKSRKLVKYGLSIEEFEYMLEDQGGLCQICQQEMTPPVVDHDHATGVVRGLLCVTCNAGIGMLKDDRELLQRAVDYLSKTGQKECS